MFFGFLLPISFMFSGVFQMFFGFLLPISDFVHVFWCFMNVFMFVFQAFFCEIANVFHCFLVFYARFYVCFPSVFNVQSQMFFQGPSRNGPQMYVFMSSECIPTCFRYFPHKYFAPASTLLQPPGGGILWLHARPDTFSVAARLPCLASTSKGAEPVLQVELALKGPHSKNVLTEARVPVGLAVADEAPRVLVAVGARLVGVLLLLDHENARDDVVPGLELPVA